MFLDFLGEPCYSFSTFIELLNSESICRVKMPNTSKREAVYFIDEYNGLNNGYSVSKVKEVLRRVGVVGYFIDSIHL